MTNKQKLQFVIDNSRLEGIIHTPEEIERLRLVSENKLSIKDAIDQVIAHHNMKYGKQISL